MMGSMPLDLISSSKAFLWLGKLSESTSPERPMVVTMLSMCFRVLVVDIWGYSLAQMNPVA